jgi:hypothetical protein
VAGRAQPLRHVADATRREDQGAGRLARREPVRPYGAGRVDTVLVAGRVVERDGRLLGHDVPAILATLNAPAAHLTAA